MKVYEFNGEKYTDLNNLALNYKDNYKLAMEDIYTNYSSLVRFIKTLSKDKELVERVRYYLAYSKYKNSALTFVIFEMLDEKAVYINGTKLTFEDFCLNLGLLNDDKNNVLRQFLRDGGLEFTYSKMLEYDFLKDDAVYLDVNSDKEETIRYLVNFYNSDEEVNKAYLNDVLNGDEKYRRFNRLLKAPTFMTYLSHTYGFKQISKSLTDTSKTFTAAKVLAGSGEYKAEVLNEIFKDTFYLWLLDNYKYYSYQKAAAKALRKRLKNFKKEYAKLCAKIERFGLDAKIEKKSDVTYFDKLMDLHNRLHQEYQYFVKLYKQSFINTKQEDYKLELPYADTYICKAYQGNKLLKLARRADDLLADNEILAQASVKEDSVAKDIAQEKPIEEEIIPEEPINEEASQEIVPEKPIEEEAAEEIKEEMPVDATDMSENYAKVDLPKADPNYIDLDDTSLDFPDVDSTKNYQYDIDRIYKSKKVQRRNANLSVFSIVFGILIAIVTIGGPILLVILSDVLKDAFGGYVFSIEGTASQEGLLRYMVMGGGLLVFAVGISIQLTIASAKTTENLTTLLFIKGGNKDKENLTLAQKQKLATVEDDEHYLEASMKEYHKLSSLAVIFLHSLQVALFAYFVLIVLARLSATSSFIKVTDRTAAQFLVSMFAGPIVTSILLFFKHPKNNWLLFLLDLVNIGAVYALTQFLFTL